MRNRFSPEALETLCQAVRDNQGEIRRYSGRNMQGTECLGICTTSAIDLFGFLLEAMTLLSSAQAARLLPEFALFFRVATVEDLGNGVVVYNTGFAPPLRDVTAPCNYSPDDWEATQPNGLTDEETSATTSVMGLVKPQRPEGEETSTFTLSLEQAEAVLAFARKKGREWKEDLLSAWLNGTDAREPNGGLLRQVRNQLGPQWLEIANLGTIAAIVDNGRYAEGWEAANADIAAGTIRNGELLKGHHEMFVGGYSDRISEQRQAEIR